jgi:PKD repeat protein
VTDNGDKTATTTRTVSVSNTAPTASFEYTPQSPAPDDEVTFDASSASDPDGEITAHDWEIEGVDYVRRPSGETVSESFGQGGSYDVTLTVQNTAGSDQAAKSNYITVIDTTADTADAISETKATSSFQVYPNPLVDGPLLVELPQAHEQVMEVQVVNVLGETVVNRKVDTQQSSLQLKLPQQMAGVYFVKVNTRKTTMTRKVVLE